MTKLKKALIITVAIIIGLVLSAGTVYFFSAKAYKDDLKTLPLEALNISDKADGTYTGSYDLEFASAKVKVTVADGFMKRIDLIEYKDKKGTVKEAETVIEHVLEAQSLDVPIEKSSHKVILKAIENAINKSN